MQNTPSYIKHLMTICTLLAAMVHSASCSSSAKDRIVVAYVIGWNDVIPDPGVMTHINFAFGNINDTFDGIVIPEFRRADGSPSDKLKKIVALKKQNPDLKVLLSIGGWGCGGFSEMASICSALYVDFPAVIDCFDFINVMSYDMRGERKNTIHNALYPSEHSGYMCTDEAVKAHLAAGVPKEKLVVGLPFYGRGVTHDYVNFRDIPALTEYNEKWDDKAQVPYLVNKKGDFELGYENTCSMTIKCHYILENEYLGAMYWDYSADSDDRILSNIVGDIILHSSHL